VALRLHPVVKDLRRAPGFTALVVLTLALGIGATTAMFSVVDAVLLRPLPYPNVERFAEIWTQPVSGSRVPGVPEGAIVRLRQDLADVAEVEGYQMASATITGGREPDIVGAPAISPRLLALVGAVPFRGRLFTDDDLTSQTSSVIISYRHWATQFGGDPDIIGRVVEIDDQPHTVIGVMSPRTRYPEANAAIWRPLNLNSAQPSRRRVQTVTVRHPGVSVDQFNARLAAASAALVEAKLLTAEYRLVPDVLLQERFGRSDRRAFWLMFGAVSLVLLVACVNVSNLLLARASTRHGEFALRSALGAGRGRLVMSAFGECAVLAIAGGLAGIVVARLLLSLLLKILPPQLTYLSASASELDLRVLVFAAAISFAACVLAGFLPSWRASRADPIDAIKRHAQAVSGRDDVWQGILIAGQLSLVLVLLAGAGLLMRSFVRLTNVETGFKPENLILLDVELPTRRYAKPGSALSLLEDVERRIEADGNTKMTIGAGAPLTSPWISFDINPEAEGGLDVDFAGQIMPFLPVAPDYFQTIGVPILAGRSFTPNDPDDVIVINDKLARRYWGEVSPLGKRFRNNAEDAWKTVIGVVGDVKQMGLNDPTGHGMEYYAAHLRNRGGGNYSILVRTERSPDEAIAAVKQVVWSLDPRLAFSDVMPMTARIGESLYRQRFFLRLSTAFTLIATALAMIGVYGAFTYWVARRHRELAIRMAIGASPERVLGLVLARALRLAIGGVVVGLAIALAGAQVMKTMLFEIDPRDPATLSVVTVLLALAAIAACAIPAARAARVDPMTTLRAE
jgi:putative ABC transport system permease protein